MSDSVTEISDFAFAWCVSLTSVIIPDCETTIGAYAFGGCQKLENVRIVELKIICTLSINNLVLLNMFFYSNIYIFPSKGNYHFTVLKFVFLSLSYNKCIYILINIVLLNPF